MGPPWIMKPRRAAEKKSKTTNARPRRESARLRRKCLDSAAGCVWGAAPFEGRTSWTICVFFIPKSLAFLAFFWLPQWGGCLKTKKTTGSNVDYLIWSSMVAQSDVSAKVSKNMIPKKITQPNCLTLIRDQCFQILDSSFCWSSCFEALLVQGTIETIYCITFLWIIRFILHIWPHHEANLRFVLVAGHWKYWVFLTVLLCACTFKGTSISHLGKWKTIFNHALRNVKLPGRNKILNLFFCQSDPAITRGS